MREATRTQAISLGYCALLVPTNGSLRRDDVGGGGEGGQIAGSVDLQLLGAVVGLVASVLFLRRIWRRIRVLLDAGVRIPRSVDLGGTWSYVLLLLLLPLGMGYTHQAHGTTDAGQGFVTLFESGGRAFGTSALFSAAAIMLFQLWNHVKTFGPQGPLTASPDPTNG